MNTIQAPKNPAKGWLSRYRHLTLEADALERAIRRAMETATNTTVALKEICVQTSGGGDLMANAVVNVVDATKILDDRRKEALRVMSEIMDAIQSVPDDVQRVILIEKYINGRTLQDVSRDVHYEKRNMIILHGKALWSVWQWMKKNGLAQ